MLTSRLKEHTKKEHASLEKKLIAVLKDISSPEDYVKILQLFYNYYETLEILIDEFIDIELLPDLKERRKAEALLNDIQYMGGEVPARGTESFPAIKTSYAALGAMYVMEGSTLGGQIISKMIGQKLGMSGPGGLSFFQAYGTDTNRMWEIFKSRLDTLSLLPDQEAEVLTAAKEVFSGLEVVFNKNYEAVATSGS